jgi:uncharacterized protein YcbX
MSAARVEGLFVHPLKSAAAIAVDEMLLDDRGAVGDRRWLVVDDNGVAITARDTPRLALVRAFWHDDDRGVLNSVRAGLRAPRNRDDALVLQAAGLADLLVPIPQPGATHTVRVWDDGLLAIDAGDPPAQWMSEALNRSCRVVRLADVSHRPLQARFAGDVQHDGRRVAFTDGAPLLVLGQSSVDALNDRLVEQGGDAVTAARFRPNVLISHTAPHAEDAWPAIRIGDVRIAMGSTCARCVMTTIDPFTGEGGTEPLRTLATYRRVDGLVMFGMNATHEAPGTLRVGDQVEVERR